MISGRRDKDLQQGLCADCATLYMGPHNADVEATFLQNSRCELLADGLYLRQPRKWFPGVEPLSRNPGPH